MDNFYCAMEDSDAIVFHEVYGSSSLQKKYTSNDKGLLTVVKQSTNKSPISLTLFHLFRSVFLPQGFPESVSDDYVTYQIWDTVQAFASSITGAMAAQAVLKGVGVGDETATVLAATMTWLLKDGSGMLGRIIFAWIQGTNLDCDAKRWRLFADILNDFAILLEILAPNFPKKYFTFIICSAGVCKSIVGVAGGATRAALTQHQARRNNMADVSAKDGSQETLVNLAALICNLVLVPMVTGNNLVIWTLYVIFTMVHLFANYSAVTAVVMETLNQARLHILLQAYFKDQVILPIAIVNKLEPVIFGTKRKLSIKLGSSLINVCQSMNDLSVLENIYINSKYILDINKRRDTIWICLHKHSTIKDQLQSLFHAELLEFVYSSHLKKQSLSHAMKVIQAGFCEDDLQKMLSSSYKLSCDMFDKFYHQVELNGWHTQTTLLGADEWRMVEIGDKNL